MSQEKKQCDLCDGEAPNDVNRRDFLRAAGTTAAVAAATAGSVAVPGLALADSTKKAADSPETKVQQLYGSLSEDQKKHVCFAWDYQDPSRGLLRTRVANNWQITDKEIASNFYTGEQRELMKEIFHGIIQPEWHDRYKKQMEDDNDGLGFGNSQSIAIFGKPGEGKFEFVITGRHMTLRCDGNSAEHVAFGGPIFYGHAADGFNEGADHPGNVFWSQAESANGLYKMLDGKQRKLALVEKGLPGESKVAFRGAGGAFQGIPVTEFSADQKENLKKVVAKLVEPYRQSDRDEVQQCLKAQGGLDKCFLAFYQEDNIGNDEVWDNWRLEGPSFVWHFRGSPHVHVWVNIADDAGVKLNA